PPRRDRRPGHLRAGNSRGLAPGGHHRGPNRRRRAPRRHLAGGEERGPTGPDRGGRTRRHPETFPRPGRRRPGRRGHWHEPGRWYPHPLDRRPDLADHPGGRGRGAAGRRRAHRGRDVLAGQARNPGGALGRRRRCGPAGGQADSRRTHGADPEWRQCGPGSLHPTGTRMTLLNPRLLLVTEDPALARTLSWVLKENGYDIVTAVGTVQLHERLEQEIYDLLVIDVGDGDAGAMTRLAASREHPGHRDTPLLVLADRQFLAAALDQFGLTAAAPVQRPYRV